MTKRFYFLELVTGIEPATCSLRMSCSAIEPHQQILSFYYRIIINKVTVFCKLFLKYGKKLL